MCSVQMSDQRTDQRGFTLVEMLVTMVIALVLMGGLMLTFVQQNNEYKYQNKRIDAVQDLEFAISFIADDLRSVVLDSPSPVVITSAGTGATRYSSQIDLTVWDESNWANTAQAVANNYQAVRRYTYDKANEILKYDRNTVPGVGMQEILKNVTDFRLFQDTPGSQPIVSGTTVFSGSPVGMQNLSVLDSTGATVNSQGYTLLIEIAVDAGYKEGLFVNARGVDVRTIETPARKRVWRYVQVHPQASAN